MHRCVCAALAVLSLVGASPTPGSAPPRSVPWKASRLDKPNEHVIFLQYGETEPALKLKETMPVEELNPTHYPARRAAAVAQHFLNARHGSPYKWFHVEQVQSATLEEIAGVGAKYHVVFSAKEGVCNQSVGLCTADVLFPEAGGDQTAPQVQCSCEGPLAINASAQEEAFYRRLRGSNSPVTGNNIPDSFGFIAPDMKPLWILAGVASSFVMLKESNENTLYNLAQVANVTQLESEDKQLKFQYHVLLHEMVSQEIIHWKLLVTWAPAGGVSVLHPERQPHCHDCVLPPATAPKERSDPE
ncbi:latexin isoform X1 [Scleropages formosus]|uniref:Latexin n=1 Tax=Scleropages formosus TaxID=113540 RepID=A0A8C9SW11_SCLFO|nr:latexin isoform X1 [Scleropages formosus]